MREAAALLGPCVPLDVLAATVLVVLFALPAY